MTHLLSLAQARPARTDLPYWWVVADEMDQLAANPFAHALDKLRSMHLILVAAHQHLGQLASDLEGSLSGYRRNLLPDQRARPPPDGGALRPGGGGSAGHPAQLSRPHLAILACRRRPLAPLPRRTLACDRHADWWTPPDAAQLAEAESRQLRATAPLTAPPKESSDVDLTPTPPAATPAGPDPSRSRARRGASTSDGNDPERLGGAGSPRQATLLDLVTGGTPALPGAAQPQGRIPRGKRGPKGRQDEVCLAQLKDRGLVGVHPVYRPRAGDSTGGTGSNSTSSPRPGARPCCGTRMPAANRTSRTGRWRRPDPDPDDLPHQLAVEIDHRDRGGLSGQCHRSACLARRRPASRPVQRGQARVRHDDPRCAARAAGRRPRAAAPRRGRSRHRVAHGLGAARPRLRGLSRDRLRYRPLLRRLRPPVGVTVTTSSERMTHLVATTETNGGDRGYWFTTQAQLLPPEPAFPPLRAADLADRARLSPNANASSRSTPTGRSPPSSRRSGGS